MENKDLNTNTILPISLDEEPQGAAPVTANAGALNNPSPQGQSVPGQTYATMPPPKFGSRRSRIVRWASLVLVILLVLGAVGLMAYVVAVQRGGDGRNVADKYAPVELPLIDIQQTGSQGIELTAQTVTINGGLVIAPSTAPTNPTAGQLYYDNASNVMAYYNGVAFVPLVPGTELSTQAVSSVQGQTGAVAFSGGNGIAITGTSINMSGVFAGSLSLTGGLSLGTPLPVSSGGIGATNLAQNGVLVGNGTAALGSVTAPGAGLCFMSTAGAPQFAACPGGGGAGVDSLNSLTGPLVLQGTTNRIGISDNGSDTITLTTPQDIHTGATPTFAGLTLSSPLGIASGGTGLSSTAANGQLLIGNGTGYGLSTLTNNGGVIITNGVGSIGLAVAYGSTANTAVQGNISLTCPAGTGNLTGGGNSITLGAGGSCNGLNTINNPTFSTSTTTPIVQNAGLTLASTGANSLQLQTNGNTRLTIASDGELTATNSLTLQGGNATLGTSSQAGTLVLHDGQGSGFTGTIDVTTLSGSQTYTLPDASGEICLTSGNCAGSGTGVTSTVGGATNRLAKFTAAQNIENSTITDDGTTVTTSVNMVIQGGSATLGTTGQTGSLVLHDGNGGQTTTLQAGNSSGNLTFILPTGAGTGFQCLKKGTGNQLIWDDCEGGGGGTSGVTSLNTFTGDLVVQGTTNQVVVTDNGSDTITLALPQDIDTGATPIFAGLTLNGALAMGANDISGTNFSVQGSSGNVTSGTINGQTISSSASFTGTVTVASTLAVQGASITSGTSSQQGSLVLHDGNGQTATISVGSALAANTVLAIPTAVSASDTFCLQTLANCTAIGGAGGDLTGTYPNPTIASIQGSAIDINTPVAGHILVYNGTNGQWENVAVTGDITISESGVATIANNAVTSAKIDNGTIINSDLSIGTFGNITGVGTLTAGALGSGFTTISVAQGGTGATSFTANGIVYGNTTGALQVTAAGTTGQCLVGNTGSAPSWASCSGLVTLQSAYTNTAGGTPEIVLDSTRGALTIRDASTPLGANLLEIQNNAGSTTYLGLTAAALTLGSNVDIVMQGNTAYISNPQAQSSSESFGLNANVAGANSLAVGGGASTHASGNSTAVGSGASSGVNGTSLGRNASTEANAVALGNGSFANSSGVAIGEGAAAVSDNSIAIGRGAFTTANNQLVIGSANPNYINHVVIGNEVTNSSPIGFTLQATSGFDNNVAGASVTIAGGQGTGTGNGGSINFQIADPGSSGSTLNSLATVASLSGTNGSALFQNTTDSTTAFRVLNTSSVPQFVIDTSNSRVYIGNPTADSTGALLVLDTKNTSGDPTGVNGALYYNSTTGSMRCFEEGYWWDCKENSRNGLRVSSEYIRNSGEPPFGIVTGNSGSSSLLATEANHPGILRFSTGTNAAGFGVTGIDNANDNEVLFGSGETWRGEASLRIPTLSGSGQTFVILAGFLDALTSDPVDGCYFRYTDTVNSGRWQGECADAGVSSCDTGITVAASTWYRLTVIVAGGQATFYVNGASTCTVSSNIPSTAGNETGFNAGIRKTGGTTARNLDIDYLEMRAQLSR